LLVLAAVVSPPDRHVSILPAGEATDAPSWWRRFRPSTVTDRKLFRASAWAGIGGFLLALLR